jgi:GT2 family glycosyltransferase
VSEPLLAVVVIGRNEEAYLGGCLEAALAAVAPFGADVVFVDSCSTDRSVEIARRHPVRIAELGASASLCPALGRLVGQQLTASRFVLFLDGDTEVDATWVRDGIAFLEAHPDVAGVSGRLREVYYADGRIVGEHADFFRVGSEPADVDELAGNAIYRRATLEAVGSFNPFLSSYEEMDLAERARQAGFRIVRLPITLGTHHTGQRGTVSELRRRYRDNLIRGYGQVLRRSLGTSMFWPHVRLMNGRHLQFQAAMLVGLLALIASVVTRDARWIGVWGALAALVTLGFMVKGRSLTKPFLLYLEWAVWSVPMLKGFLETPRDPRALVVADVIERVEDGGRAIPTRQALDDAAAVREAARRVDAAGGTGGALQTAREAIRHAP